MIKASFHIVSPGINTGNAQLFIEIGPAGLNWTISDANQTVLALAVYHLPSAASTSEIAVALDELIAAEPLLHQPFAKTEICWAFPASILIPPAYQQVVFHDEMLNLVHGDLQTGGSRTDYMYKQNIYNLYRIPTAVSECIDRHFPYASQSHQYSVLPQLVSGSGNNLLAVFYSNSVTVLLQKDGSLQFIRNFAYHIPDDAAYHLLQSCKAFELEPDTVNVQLSGMIDAGSNLYAELYKYFLHMDFLPVPENIHCAEAISKEPAHYFSYLFALAACV